MSNAQLEAAIEAAWEVRDTITPSTGGETREAIEDTLNALDGGHLRVAEKMENGDWHVNQWAKKAVLLGFRLKDMEQQDGGPQGGHWWDKVDSKFKGWGDHEWTEAGFRAVPNCVVRKSAYIAPGVVLMPSFVNLGAHVDEGLHQFVIQIMNNQIDPVAQQAARQFSADIAQSNKSNLHGILLVLRKDAVGNAGAALLFATTVMALTDHQGLPGCLDATSCRIERTGRYADGLTQTFRDWPRADPGERDVRAASISAVGIFPLARG